MCGLLEGLWRQKKAIKTFEEYKTCTEIYCAQWESGLTLENLTVAG